MKKYIIKNETQTVMPAIRKEALLTILHYATVALKFLWTIWLMKLMRRMTVYQISKLQNSL